MPRMGGASARRVRARPVPGAYDCILTPIEAWNLITNGEANGSRRVTRMAGWLLDRADCPTLALREGWS